jgi:hypothetical protein
MKNASVSRAVAGKGPLLERDYWAVIAGCRFTAPDVARLVAEQFPIFPPDDLVRFRRMNGAAPLAPGDELAVEIRHVGTFAVRVVHRDRNSFTVATLTGHPEAGRITFGAYPNSMGDVVFHIRSRARSGSRARYLEFIAGGDAMQTNTWTDFINRLAVMVGDGVLGYIQAEKREVAEEPGDAEPWRPTFIARGE